MLARIAAVVVLLSFVSLAWAGGGTGVVVGHDYQEFDLNMTPSHITAGPDGAMWFTDELDGAIGRIASDGLIRSFPVTNSSFAAPVDITTGPDGNLWFTDPGNTGAIGRMTVQGEPIEFPLPSLGYPQEIVTGPDGNLWFTLNTVLVDPVAGATTGTLGRITPNGTVSLFPLEFPVFGLTAGPDRALWVTDEFRVGRVTTNGQDQFFEVDAAPVGITSGPDGALWFTAGCLQPAIAAGFPDTCDYGVGRLTTGGQLRKFPAVDQMSEPLAITRGPEDNLWFTRDDGRVSRITLDGRVDDIVINTGASPIDLAVGPDGALWFTLPRLQRIARVSSLAFGFLNIANGAPLGLAPGIEGSSIWFTDVDGNRVGHLSRNNGLIQYELGPTHGPTAIAAALDGGAYFTNFDAGTIGRITPNGDFVEYALPPFADSPEDIVRGPDGNFWFTIDINSIGRITPEGAVKTFPVPTQDAGPLGIAVGADGNLWFTEMLVNKIGRITTDGDAVDFPIPSVNAAPWDIAAGPDGALYFTESGNGRLGRITTDGHVTELGVADPTASPRDIAVGPDGALWFSIVPVYPEPPPDLQAAAPRPRVAEDPTPTPTLGPGRLGRLARDGRITSFNIPAQRFRVGGDSPASMPAGIAGTDNGNLFVALYDLGGLLSIELASAVPTPTELPTEIPTETPTQPRATATATVTSGVPGATPTPTELGGEPTETPTTGVPAATATATEPGAEPTETATPETSVTPTAPASCAGDCDGNQEVSISELISAVNIALDQRSIDACPAIDSDGDGEVHINDLIAAVSRALQGC